MDYVDILRFSDVRPLDVWTRAPIGAFLQLRIADQITAGMRTTYPAVNGEPDAFLVLGGKHAGEMISDEYLRGVAALDVSLLLEIVAIDPAPFQCATINQMPHGALLRYPDTDVYFVWLMMQKGTGSGAVCVASNDPKCPVGSCYPQINKNRLIGIASKVDLRLRELKEKAH
jgi:hypothetical protein